MKSKNIFWIILFVITAYFIWMITQNPYIAYADGSIYVEVAENFAKGKGFNFLNNGEIHQYVFWPPLFPALLGWISSLFHVDIITATKILRILLVIYLLFILYRIFRLLKLQTQTILLGFFFLWFSWTFSLYYTTLSETLFLPLFLTSVYFLLKWSDNRMLRFLVYAGLFAGLSLLTRYAAFGIIPSLIFILLILRKDLKTGLKHVAAFTIPVLLIFLPWYLYTRQFTPFFDRKFHIHLLSPFHIEQFYITAANWLVPGLTVFLIIPLLLLIFYVIFKYRKSVLSFTKERKIQILLLIAVIYLLFIIFSISFIDFDTPMDFRILAPFYMLLLPVGLVFLEKIRWINSKIFLGLLLILVVSHGVEGFVKTKNYMMETANYTHLNNTAFIRTIEKNQKRKIWSNVTDIIKMYVENDTLLREMPVKYERMSLIENKNYGKQLDELKENLDKDRGMIIYYYLSNRRDFQPTKEELIEQFRDYPVIYYDEGMIIFHSAFKDSLDKANHPQ